MQTELILISGGEPLLNPEWPQIALMLREAGLKLWLLTSGLSLAKHARRVSELFDAVTVSLDGTHARTYAAIRGIDAFDKVCEGIRAATSQGIRPNVRVTLQRANYTELSGFVDLAREVGARQVSFLAVDVANPHAFGRNDNFASDLALRTEDLPRFDRLLQVLEEQYAEDFRSGFIAESPQKLRRILQYFEAIHGRARFPPVRCNAPEFSAVVTATGHVQPCFFIAGPPVSTARTDLGSALNSNAMQALRAAIRAGERTECTTCVCSMHRDPDALERSLLP
jgi:MoaA/NifB/PqqE/SkfB family radical SAM enzyme